jgi:dihydrodipicolinate synthase/N-acetylneuraminate lyase
MLLSRHTRRREFITLLGGAAAAWPIAARAEQSGTPVIGVLGAIAPEGLTERWRAFRQGLKEAGYADAAKFALALASHGSVRTRTFRVWPQSEFHKLVSELP